MSKFLTGPSILVKMRHVKKWLVVLLLLSSALLIAIFLDQPISLWFDQPERNGLRLFSLAITDIGKSEQWFALSILILILGKAILLIRPQSLYIDKIKNLMAWAAHLFIALIVSGLILHLIKMSVGRERPHISPTRDPFVFHPGTVNWDFESFPSGHTQTLFCVAFLFVLLWPKKNWLFWTLAALLSYTRVTALQHFTSDIIGGAIIGVLGSQLSIWFFSKKIQMPRPLD